MSETKHICFMWNSRETQLFRQTTDQAFCFHFSVQKFVINFNFILFFFPPVQSIHKWIWNNIDVFGTYADQKFKLQQTYIKYSNSLIVTYTYIHFLIKSKWGIHMFIQFKDMIVCKYGFIFKRNFMFSFENKIAHSASKSFSDMQVAQTI